MKDQVVIVTGASRGIGKGIAEAFAAHGAKVACLATTESGAAKVAETLNGARAYACNVGDAAQVAEVFAKIEAEMGVPSVLVNNAGIARDNLLVRLTDEAWDEVLNVNLKGAFLCARAVARPMMKARYGRIVNLSSVIGVHGAAGQGNYAASKAGLIGLTKSIAKELGGRGVTCNAVAPGFIETDMTSELPGDFKDQAIKNSPCGRLGTVKDIADAVIFLARPESSFITGQVLEVDGGLFL